MFRLFIVLVISSFLFFSCGHHKDDNPAKTVQKGNNFNVKIPSGWIEKLRHSNYVRKDSSLLYEFEHIVGSGLLNNPHWQHVDPNYGRVFSALSVDLDGDGNDEMIAFLGWDVDSPSLCVFKQEDGDWYLIYMEQIDTFYSAPTLYVANNFSKNKTFYFRHVYNHGSGIYEDGYSFYKLIDNKVHKCLELVNEAHIYGWGLYMNQEVKMNFELSGDDSDGVGVDYNYNFFPGAVKDGDCSWCANTDISLIKGDNSVDYKWNNKKLIYELDIPSYQNQVDDLTAEKIACFGAFGNDTLFVHAFKGQINEVLKTGRPEQKKLLKKYLAMVKQDGKAITEEIEETTEAGGTKFYGVKKKKKSAGK
jgi:hypothetical protein